MGLFSRLINNAVNTAVNTAVRTGVTKIIENSDLPDVGKIFGNNESVKTAPSVGQRDADLYTIIINGKSVEVPIRYDEFLSVTGLRQTQSSNYGYDVTDGYSTFFVGVKDNYVRDFHVYRLGVNDINESAFNPEKSEIIFPGGLTFNKTKSETANLYPFKNMGKFETNTYCDDFPADIWTIEPEKNKSSILAISYRDFDNNNDFGNPGDKPTTVFFFTKS
jgi:hypothetical protein